MYKEKYKSKGSNQSQRGTKHPLPPPPLKASFKQEMNDLIGYMDTNTLRLDCVEMLFSLISLPLSFSFSFAPSLYLASL